MLLNHLPQLMERQNVSIRQLSRATGITYTTIRAVYHSQRRSVQLEVLDAICEALRVQPGDIYRHVSAVGEQISETIAETPGPLPPKANSRQARTRRIKGDLGGDWRSW